MPRAKRVVVTTSFPHNPGDAAGCFVEADVRALEGEVHVLCPAGEPRSVRSAGAMCVHAVGGDELFAWPGAVERFRKAPWRILGAFTFARGVRRKLAELWPFEAVIAHWLIPSALLCEGYPLERAVAHGADVRLLLRMPSALRARIVRSLLRARLQFVAASLLEQLLSSLPAALARAVRERSFVEPCPLSLPPLDRPTRERARALPRYLAVCGRLVADKRIELALQAAAKLDAQMVVIGDGPLRDELRRLHPEAMFTGQLPRTQALAFIAEAAALVSCSRHEAAPTVVREARALGVPVVATASGDVAHWAATDPGIWLADPESGALADLIGVATHDARSRSS
ncbi:MAG TPA: glycosyltransferase [Polyangiaceae bacterium]|jgi:glycosyltransferase involved in cell wall biosynthesis|nr:glycosyltransferase [Polyangiaceae bacterium]